MEKLQKAIFENKIDKIYSGADNACRCGCRGKYYESNSKMFKRILNKVVEKMKESDVDIQHYKDCGMEWINIGYGDNRAYTVYFK